jgi:hypothetical protein
VLGVYRIAAAITNRFPRFWGSKTKAVAKRRPFSMSSFV